MPRCKYTEFDFLLAEKLSKLKKVKTTGCMSISKQKVHLCCHFEHWERSHLEIFRAWRFPFSQVHSFSAVVWVTLPSWFMAVEQCPAGRLYSLYFCGGTNNPADFPLSFAPHPSMVCRGYFWPWIIIPISCFWGQSAGECNQFRDSNQSADTRGLGTSYICFIYFSFVCWGFALNYTVVNGNW